MSIQKYINKKNNIYMDKKVVLKRVGKNIQRIRKEKGYTQESFSELMNVSWSYVAKIEMGTLNLSLGKLVELSNYLETDISELLKEI